MPAPLDQTALAVAALREQRFEEAEHLARKALWTNGGDIVAAQALGHALLQLNRPADAVAPLQAAARRSSDPALGTLLGRALCAAGRREEGLEALRGLTMQPPPFRLAFVELGDQLAAVGRFDEAARIFEQGLRLMPGTPALKLGLGYVHLKRNNRAAARALFQEVRAAAPERQDAMAALAGVLAAEGEFAAAADLYRDVLRLQPNDAASRLGLGKCLMELGDVAAGQEMIRQSARGSSARAGLAIMALASNRRGRVFLRPSEALKFLGVDTS